MRFMEAMLGKGVGVASVELGEKGGFVQRLTRPQSDRGTQVWVLGKGRISKSLQAARPSILT